MKAQGKEDKSREGEDGGGSPDVGKDGVDERRKDVAKEGGVGEAAAEREEQRHRNGQQRGGERQCAVNRMEGVFFGVGTGDGLGARHGVERVPAQCPKGSND